MTSGRRAAPAGSLGHEEAPELADPEWSDEGRACAGDDEPARADPHDRRRRLDWIREFGDAVIADFDCGQAGGAQPTGGSGHEGLVAVGARHHGAARGAALDHIAGWRTGAIWASAELEIDVPGPHVDRLVWVRSSTEGWPTCASGTAPTSLLSSTSRTCHFSTRDRRDGQAGDGHPVAQSSEWTMTASVSPATPAGSGRPGPFVAAELTTPCTGTAQPSAGSWGVVGAAAGCDGRG